MEVGLAEVVAAPGRRWKPWENASTRAVDTVEIGPLRVWVSRLSSGGKRDGKIGALDRWCWQVGAAPRPR